MYSLIAEETLTIEIINRSKVGGFKFNILNENGASVFSENAFLKIGKMKSNNPWILFD